jgi:hypothetical protein
VFLVRYELSFYITEDSILHSHRRGKLKSYKLLLTLWSSLCIATHCLSNTDLH